MTIFLYFLNVACSAGQSTLSKQYASSGGNANVYNINKTVVGLLVFLAVGLYSGLAVHAPTILLGIGYGAAFSVSNYAGFTALSMGPMALTSIIASFSLVIPFLVGITVWGESLSVLGILGIGYGAAFSISNYAGFTALSLGPMALTSIIASFSLVIPFLVGITAWGETLSVLGILGILLLFCSIVLLNYKKSNDPISGKWLFYTFLTFLSNGICSLIQKQHQRSFPGLFRTEFMICALLFMLLILLATVALRREIKSSVVFCIQGSTGGLAEGTANYIVLYLAATQNASVLFPVMSVAKIIAVWIIGRLAFRERMKAMQTIGLVAGIAAIVLLNLK